MPDKPDNYFLIVYDLEKHEVEVQEFGPDFDKAAENYAMLERRYSDNELMEIVLVGADSLETIHKTHSHYFAKIADRLFDELLASLSTPKQ